MIIKPIPECLHISNDTYPYWFGARYPHQFAETDCRTCSWYSEDWHRRRDKELTEKEFDFVKIEV